jgi:Ca2+-transporting ATPase
VSKDCSTVFDRNVPLGDRKNIAYASTIVENGHGKGVVITLGKKTEIGKIAESLKETKKSLTPLQKNIQSIGKILTYIILLIASITFVLEVISNPSQILNAFLTAVAISVAAIPESLPAVITIIMSLGVGKLSKQRAIVKHMHAVETLGACDVICSDKTGTITQNKMKVEKNFTFFSKKSAFFDVFLKNMSLCNDAKLGQKGYVGSSTEVALVDYAKKCGLDVEAIRKNSQREAELSFSSERKMMSTLCTVGAERFCFSKGAVDRILKKCTFFADENKILPLDESAKQKILSQNKKMCADALRVICFAFKPLDSKGFDEQNLVFLGLCALADPPRKEIFDAVKKCRKAGMRPIMITGDFKDTAFAVAKKVGIAQSENDVLSGEEIDELSDEEFAVAVEKTCVFARVSPAHKVKIVEVLQKNGHIVAMTGDGVNDAPSLKKADIGIGMGKSGTDVVKDVADIIITDDNFATIVVAVEEGRKIYSNIQKTIKYLFSANMAEILSLFLITIFLPGRTFLSPVQILFVNLITDSLPAIALGTQEVEGSAMLEKPRSKNSGLFSDGVGVSLICLGLVQTVLTTLSYFLGYFLRSEAVAMTMAFYTLNLIQLFYMFTARTKESCFKSNPFKNKFFSLSLVLGFGLLSLMIFTGFGSVLKLEKLDALCWMVVIAMSISIIFIGELFKILGKLFRKNKLH